MRLERREPWQPTTGCRNNGVLSQNVCQRLSKLAIKRRDVCAAIMTFPKRDQQAHLADLRFNKKKFLLVPELIIPHSHAIMRLSDSCDSRIHRPRKSRFYEGGYRLVEPWVSTIHLLKRALSNHPRERRLREAKLARTLSRAIHIAPALRKNTCIVQHLRRLPTGSPCSSCRNQNAPWQDWLISVFITALKFSAKANVTPPVRTSEPYRAEMSDFANASRLFSPRCPRTGLVHNHRQHNNSADTARQAGAECHANGRDE